MCAIFTSEAFIGVVIGGLITFCIEWHFKRREEKRETAHSASLLLNDLRSMIKYAKNINNATMPTVNIRYSEDWQSMAANCAFLNGREIEKLYQIYDLVYDYNFEYEHGRKEQWGGDGVSFPIAHELLPAIADDLGVKALCAKLEKYCKRNREMKDR